LLSFSSSLLKIFFPRGGLGVFCVFSSAWLWLVSVCVCYLRRVASFFSRQEILEFRPFEDRRICSATWFDRLFEKKNNNNFFNIFFIVLT
jgi:hypothetical protein